MNRCYSFFLAACIFVAGAVAQAQTDPFVIGVNGFAPEFHPMLHRTHFVRGVRATPTADERLHFLSPTQFTLAREPLRPHGTGPRRDFRCVPRSQAGTVDVP